VFVLAPNARSIGRLKKYITTVRITDMISWVVKQFPRIFSALALSPLPMRIEARGAPPFPTSAAKADIIIIRGMQIPTPVSAREPFPGI